MRKILLSILGTAALLTACHYITSIASPDGNIEFIYGDTVSEFEPAISIGGTTELYNLRIGLVVDGKTYGPGMAFREGTLSEESYGFPVNGNFDRAEGEARRQTLTFEDTEGAEYAIELFISNEAVAYRHIFAGADAGAEYVVEREVLSFQLPRGTCLWSAEHYEAPWSKRNAGTFLDTVAYSLPVVIERDAPGLGPNGKRILFTEARALDYPAVSLRTSADSLSLTFQRTPNYQSSYAFTGRLITPWRVFLINDDLDGLVNNPTVQALNDAPGPAYADADWIQPGRSGWTWISGGFPGQNYANMRRQITAAGELGLEYMTVDDGWEHWPDKWTRIRELTALGDSVDVGVILWKPTGDYQAAWQTRKFGPQDTIRGLLDPAYRADFLDSCRAAGVAGLKVDFVDEYNVERVNFVRDMLEDAAAHQLVINFHGASKPSGLERTYPNLLVYESVRGLENVWNSPDLTHQSTIIPFTRYPIGSGDYTPVMGRATNAGTRAHQLATAVTMLAPLNSFAASPVQLLDLPERALIEDLPVVWDETRVLAPSAIGKAAVFAKRKGDDWYLAVLAGREPLDFYVDLPAFLPAGTYQADIWQDDFDGGERNELETLVETIDPAKTFRIRTLRGGGAVVRFREE